MKSKYNNRKIEYDGILFDSKKECEFYKKFKMLEKFGKIKQLKLQVKFELIPGYEINNKKIRKTVYKADFVYYDIEEEQEKVIDVKGFKTEVYKLKKKLFEYMYKTEIQEY